MQEHANYAKALEDKHKQANKAKGDSEKMLVNDVDRLKREIKERS